MKNTNKKSGISGLIVGIAGGIAAIGAATFATMKVTDDIKKDSKLTNLISPDGNHKVSVIYGSSKTARGLFSANVIATSGEMQCSLRIISIKKLSAPAAIWESDNTAVVSFSDANGKTQSVVVNFEEDKIEMYHEK